MARIISAAGFSGKWGRPLGNIEFGKVLYVFVVLCPQSQLNWIIKLYWALLLSAEDGRGEIIMEHKQSGN